MRNTDSSLSSPDLRRRLHRRLLQWYRTNKRSLPWRDVDNPYYVLISEFMAQQTQLARVEEHFPRWIVRFPDISTLAAASRRSLLLAWSGMGYNRRALNLHAAAMRIVEEHGGRIPDDPTVLQSLPGIGRYTAHAVACFGYGKRVPVVDVNVRRVLSRLSRNMNTTETMLDEKEAWILAADLLPPRACYNWSQGLMDLGAGICTARKPRCSQCPLSTVCSSAHRLRTPERKAAPVVRETPRRIYRGRVIELLRRAAGHCSDAERIRCQIFGSTDPADRQKLIGILASLEKDGMVTVYQGKKRISDVAAHSAPLSALRICLVK